MRRSVNTTTQNTTEDMELLKEEYNVAVKNMTNAVNIATEAFGIASGIVVGKQIAKATDSALLGVLGGITTCIAVEIAGDVLTHELIIKKYPYIND